MNAIDMNDLELQALTGLIGHVMRADGSIDPGEKQELEFLGAELGLSDFHSRVNDVLTKYPSHSDILSIACKVEREDARQLIRTILLDMAQSDGDRGQEELELVEKVMKAWGYASHRNTVM